MNKVLKHELPSVGSNCNKYSEHPSRALLRESGFDQNEYNKFHNVCIRERNKMGAGNSKNMNTLFRFWSYFLRTNMNYRMYSEFKLLAEDDSNQSCNYGSECLFRFWSYGLENNFDERIYSDFEHKVLQQHNDKNLYGLEKLWAFHFYRDNRNIIHIDDKIQQLLNVNFRYIGDFHKAIK
jgi:la-related protein 1